MRWFVAHALAILGMLPVLFAAFALMLNSGQLNEEAYGIALIYMAFFGPVVLIATLIYYAIFRARNGAIQALAASGALVFFATRIPFVADRLGLWLLIALAGIAAAVTHHLIIRALRRWTAPATPAA